MATLRIATNEVRVASAEILRCGNDLHSQLSNIRTQMNQTSATWQSQAADAIRENFVSTADRFFNKYREIIEEYSRFLDVTVSKSYEELEQQLTGNANRFEI